MKNFIIAAMLLSYSSHGRFHFESANADTENNNNIAAMKNFIIAAMLLLFSVSAFADSKWKRPCEEYVYAHYSIPDGIKYGAYDRLIEVCISTKEYDERIKSAQEVNVLVYRGELFHKADRKSTRLPEE